MYRIIRYLCPGEARLCVVGDDAQSIYAFRGADIGNILNFQTHWLHLVLVPLAALVLGLAINSHYYRKLR